MWRPGGAARRHSKLRIEEVAEDTPEAFLKRQRLVRLLVERITVGRGLAGETTVEITYRFGPPEGEDAPSDEEAVVAGVLQNSCGNLAANRKPSGTTSRHFSTVERRGVPKKVESISTVA